jgi:aspartyl-tRNA(Asn)/glutamyl-tRNA(Gln) amidotransferase subunit A
MIDLKNLTIKAAREGLDSKQFSAVELAESYLNEIQNKNSDLNAYLEVFSDVVDQAKGADARLAMGESLPLLGIPVAVKDNILIKDRKAGAASKILENYVATYDATVISKLKLQGAVFLGRTNMDEFALGSSTENSAYGVTHNPHDAARVSGGTSGGSAAAVSATMSLVALGSDTGGSVRQPSSFCGVVGLKPTYGAVSRSGLIAATSSFDQIGPIGKTVCDVETVFNVIRGQDPLDSTTIPNYELSDSQDKKLKIGVPWSLVNSDGVDSSVRDNFNQSIEILKSFGHEIIDISLPNMLSVYYILNFAEVSSNLARFDGVKYGLHVDGKNLLEDYMLSRGQGFGKEARRRIILGTYILSSGYYDAYYGKAQLAQAHMRSEFEKIFTQVDCIASPTAPTPAWKIGEKNDPLAMYLEDIFTVTANIVGLPAISLPSGSVSVEGKDLPLGLQIMAPHMGEGLLFSLGKKFLNE